jgi:hypothetical protein
MLIPFKAAYFKSKLVRDKWKDLPKVPDVPFISTCEVSSVDYVRTDSSTTTPTLVSARVIQIVREGLQNYSPNFGLFGIFAKIEVCGFCAFSARQNSCAIGFYASFHFAALCTNKANLHQCFDIWVA